MTTDKRNATANGTQPVSLMEQASRSTTNLGWLQDYLQCWQTYKSLTLRLYKMQEQQQSFDMTAHEALHQMSLMAQDKIDALQEAYNRMYSAHERLMRRVLEGSDNNV